MLKDIKAGMSKGADATARAAKRSKLIAEIQLLEGKVSTAKKDFGKAVYSAMEARDEAEVARIFGETKARVDSLNQDIADKRTKVESLRTPAEKASAVPEGVPVATMPGPPPGPPPQDGPPLPPGWKKATSPDGRDYYYHSETGETSWTIPAS